jgi:hypothetical protein
MGILVSRGRMQNDDRTLAERAKKWAAAVHGQFQTIPVKAQDVVPPPSNTKMY